MADALQPLADAIAERVWAETCQEFSFGSRRQSAAEFRPMGVFCGALREAVDEREGGEKPYMLQTRMVTLKGNTSTNLQLDLNAWHEREMRRALSSRRSRDFQHWTRLVREASIDPRVDFDLLMDCLILSQPARECGAGVYFLRSGGLIKIGVSRDVRRRVAQITATTPFPVNLEVVAWGGPWLERFLHVAFAEHREAREWFHPNPTLCELIRLLKLIATTPDRRYRRQ